MAKLRIRWFEAIRDGLPDESKMTHDDSIDLGPEPLVSEVAPGWARYVELHAEASCLYAFGDVLGPHAMRMPADLTLAKATKARARIVARGGF